VPEGGVIYDLSVLHISALADAQNMGHTFPMGYQPSDEIGVKHRSSKDTSDWCRGKRGVDHRREWVPDKNFATHYKTGIPWREMLICSVCGKTLDRRRIMYSFGALTKALREASGMSQAELGRRIEMHQEALSRVEADLHEVRLSTMRRIAEALGARLEVTMAEMPIAGSSRTD
jgi:DNA-binding XRE family transcriptional regulator